MDMQNKNMNTAPQQEERDGKKRWLLLLLLLLLLLIVVAVAIFGARYFRGGGNDTPNTDDVTPLPPRIETNAEPVTGDNSDEKLDAPEGGGAVSLTYSKAVSIDLAAKKASLLFQNPSRSNQDTVIQLVIGDAVIVQSGSLAPGSRVTTLDLAEGAEKRLKAGGYDGKIVVSFYDQSSGQWAAVNAEIPVNVTVNK